MLGREGVLQLMYEAGHFVRLKDWKQGNEELETHNSHRSGKGRWPQDNSRKQEIDIGLLLWGKVNTASRNMAG